ncbi:unnamed protein product [Lepeophtheirus salmonis]|uniref:(salmon louse) hypothetical protein n=1 Tax=Lepeophtheirus salmonis TaxID=72036 RepID=A0A7R8CKC9_LEPSM|nr:unnamed protein product [Lepeophtheirus salmonis]CAF2845952.1 unnamed protein product [Lepeophtheirus salmonis]
MAHALSRSPADKPTNDYRQDMYGLIHTIKANLLDPLNSSGISQIECDPITLECIAHNILEKINKQNINPVLREPYAKILPHLTIKDDPILFGDRIIIPRLKRDQILQRLHSSHQEKREDTETGSSNYFLVWSYSRYTQPHRSFPLRLCTLKLRTQHLKPFRRGTRIEKHTTLTCLTVTIPNCLWKTNESRLPAHNLSLAEDWQVRLNEHDKRIVKQHEYA